MLIDTRSATVYESLYQRFGTVLTTKPPETCSIHFELLTPPWVLRMVMIREFCQAKSPLYRYRSTALILTRPSEANDASFSDFFIFQQLFHSFTLLDRPSSQSLLPPQPSLLLVPPSSSSLLPPRPLFSSTSTVKII